MKFAVYMTEIVNSSWAVQNVTRKYVGDTEAVSAKKAIMNIRYRIGDAGYGKKYDNGPAVIRRFEAIPV